MQDFSADDILIIESDAMDEVGLNLDERNILSKCYTNCDHRMGLSSYS